MALHYQLLLFIWQLCACALSAVQEVATLYAFIWRQALHNYNCNLAVCFRERTEHA